MPEYIFNHHGRIIDQDTDRENQCEQTNAVNRVIHHHCPPDGEQNNNRDNRNNHDCCTHPQTDQAQHSHNHRRFHHGTEQIINLVVGRLAVVTRHGNIDV